MRLKNSGKCSLIANQRIYLIQIGEKKGKTSRYQLSIVTIEWLKKILDDSLWLVTNDHPNKNFGKVCLDWRWISNVDKFMISQHFLIVILHQQITNEQWLTVFQITSSFIFCWDTEISCKPSRMLFIWFTVRMSTNDRESSNVDKTKSISAAYDQTPLVGIQTLVEVIDFIRL